MFKELVISFLLLQTVSYAEWQNTLSDAYHNVKKNIQPTELSAEEKKAKKFRILWEDVFEEYQEGVMLLDKSQYAPNEAWFKKDQIDYKGDIDEVINNIIKILIDDDLLAYKDELDDINNEVSELRADRTEFFEKKIHAPIKSRVSTTQTEYEEKIKDTNDKIKVLEGNINTIKIRVQQRFENNGINLSLSDINQLISRVYGNDIIQMTVIFEVLKKITKQIGMLMQESQEDLAQSKKYYGMHLISLQLVVHIQQEYMNSVDNYILQVDSIIQKTDEMIKRTSSAYELEKDKDLKSGYLNNQEIQSFNKSVAQAYKQDLLESQAKIALAQQTTIAQLKLAENTYQTVSLSGKLYSLIQNSNMLFKRITEIQVPKLEPFKNQKMKLQYDEITTKLLSD
ncbi:MAG: Unknown protein [uncultured Sulfurovum sp.]|uniref:Uncharacterized protein n=1 Tax=uncultured Sulfurovum sp. TaxID=269237 RepID=A0A6S6SCZ9_9BACT|nr:MAG: Unknown protein [uncultured Sulfurovum sp.]